MTKEVGLEMHIHHLFVVEHVPYGHCAIIAARHNDLGIGTQRSAYLLRVELLEYLQKLLRISQCHPRTIDGAPTLLLSALKRRVLPSLKDHCNDML